MAANSVAGRRKTKHTVGPWSQGLRVKGDRFVEIWSETAERAVAKVWIGGMRETKLDAPIKASVLEEDANARLITAAPDLYDALLFVKQFFVKLEEDTKLGDPLRAIRLRIHAPIHAAIDAAINKATHQEATDGSKQRTA